MKVPLANIPYDITAHQYLTIRHDRRPQDGIDDVVFEAGASPGPAAATELVREPCNAAIAANALVFELKAGTSAPEAKPGVVVFDNFHAAASGR